MLLVDGQPIAQTGAVARFCGKLSGHYPDDPWLAAQVDMWIDAATDVTHKVTQTMRFKDPIERLAARQRLVDGELAKWLSNFERLLNDHQQGQWLVGEQLSIADLAVWRLCGWLTGGFLDGIPTTVLEPYPKLQAISNSVGELREIKEWMKRYNKVS